MEEYHSSTKRNAISYDMRSLQVSVSIPNIRIFVPKDVISRIQKFYASRVIYDVTRGLVLFCLDHSIFFIRLMPDA